MPFYAQLNADGICIAVTEMDAATQPKGAALVPITGMDAGLLGRRWKAGKWQAAEPLAQAVPERITRAQGKAALIRAGLWKKVQGFVAAIPDESRRALAEVALNDTLHWERSSPLMAQAAKELGLSDEQMYELFKQAAEIEL